MRDFPDAVFAPETVEVMGEALDASVSTLPDPVTASQVNLLAESILRTAQAGEHDTTTLQRMALLELQLTDRV
jgi:imidazolonepropionase-like amidohydrolase